jgi:hypothetical protein
MEATLLSDMFVIWGQMKKTAAAYRRRSSPVAIGDARTIVQNIFDEEHVECPPPEALDYLASEFVRLCLEARPNSVVTLDRRSG